MWFFALGEPLIQAYIPLQENEGAFIQRFLKYAASKKVFILSLYQPLTSIPKDKQTSPAT